MTIQEVGNSFFCNELGQLVDKKPYMAFVIMSSILEFIGKCYSKRPDFQQTGYSKNDYYDAINKLDSLEKYRVFNYPPDNNGQAPNNNYLYTHLRCGMLHAFLPDGDIILAPSENDLSKKIVGARELYTDLQKAWEEIKQNAKIASSINGNLALNVAGELSGSTSTNVVEIVDEQNSKKS